MVNRQSTSAEKMSGRLVVAAVVIGALATVVWWLTRAPVTPRVIDEVAQARARSSYLNVAAGINYIGDSACVQCHPLHGDSFAEHPMGRSLFPIESAPTVERYDPVAHNPFQALDFHFIVEQRAPGLVHAAQKRDARNRVVAEAATPAAYAIGSGVRGRSYLFNRDGYLFQSPISWYSQKNIWDLSPLFERFYPPDRVVEVSCLFCHANRVHAFAETRNRYYSPIFDGHTIGCERCHGPGALHAAERAKPNAVGGADFTIVNPRRLTPELREAVCQQCHLQGEKRVVRYGRDLFDFQPGLELDPFLAVFVRSPEFVDKHKAVGHVEQMYASRCFRASNGKLGCISCHEPHSVPLPEQKVQFYRQQCLECHVSAGCKLSERLRTKQQPDDNCIACHMPKMTSSNIAHTAITDHRIPRMQLPPERDKAPTRRLLPGESPIVEFFPRTLPGSDAPQARDHGVALSLLANDPSPVRNHLAMEAVRILEKAVQYIPFDVQAWESLGFSLTVLGQAEQARTAFDTALRLSPERELTLYLAAKLAEKTQRRQEAIGLWKRIIAVNPWIWEYHFSLAKQAEIERDWSQAYASSTAALPLNPADQQTLTLVVISSLRIGKVDEARKHLVTMKALNPPDESRLQEWFDVELRESRH